MTQLGDELLIAYSDGELSTRQREEIGCVLEHDPVTDLRLKKLQNTRNRLAILFEDILQDHKGLRVENIISLPRQAYAEEVPQPEDRSLADNRPARTQAVPSLASLPARPDHGGTGTVPGQEKITGRPQGYEEVLAGVSSEREQSAQGKAGKSVGKAILNVLSATGILAGGLAVGYFYQDYAGSGLSDEAVPNLYAPVVNGGWTTAVIHHHSLLRRETIEASMVNQKDIRLIRNQLEKALGMAVMIPDFSGHGLSFARAQILTHNNSKIAQFTYLPKQGSPVSLYVKQSGKDAALNNGSLGQVSMVHWAQGGKGFVLSGSLPHWQLIVMSVGVKRQFAKALARKY